MVIGGDWRDKHLKFIARPYDSSWQVWESEDSSGSKSTVKAGGAECFIILKEERECAGFVRLCSRILWPVRLRPRAYEVRLPNFRSRLWNTLASGLLQSLESAVLRDREPATLAQWTLRHLTSWHLEAYDRNILSF